MRQKACFTAQLQVEFNEWIVNCPERSPIALFLRFLGAESLTAIVDPPVFSNTPSGLIPMDKAGQGSYSQVEPGSLHVRVAEVD